MIKFKHVYVIQRKEDDGFTTYTATFPALPNMGGISDTPEGAISALKSVLIHLLQDIENEQEDEDVLPESLEDEEIVGFGVLEATSDDELPAEDEIEE